MTAKKETQKSRVESILHDQEETRNCDKALTIAYWRKYEGEHISLYQAPYSKQSAVEYVKLENVRWLTSQDSIKRVRAIIQNKEGKYLPTNSDIRKKRSISEEQWVEFIRQTNIEARKIRQDSVQSRLL